MNESKILTHDGVATRAEKSFHNQAIDLLFLSDEKKEILRKKIIKSGGIVRVFIHPYYSQNNGEKSEATKSSKGLDVILSSSSIKTPPIIIFEELNMIEKTVKHLNSVNQNPTTDILLVETNPKTSNPKSETVDRTEEERWKVVIDALLELGVTKILIGGERLEIIGGEHLNFLNQNINSFREQRIEQGANNTHYDFFGCVGHAINHFVKLGIAVDISNFSYPESRINMLQHEKSEVDT